MKFKILIIEDDPVIARFVAVALETNDYEVQTAASGAVGLKQLQQFQPDCVLLDLGLPDYDGNQLILDIRRESTVPIIVVSARGKEKDKVSALDLGANDYVTKPFNIGEVLARIRVTLRSKTDDTITTFCFLDLTVDFEKRLVTIHDQEVHFTPIEFKMLTLLLQHQGKVLTHSFIQHHVWGYPTMDDYRTIRVFMAAIRRKISLAGSEHTYIVTEVGVGYRFVEA